MGGWSGQGVPPYPGLVILHGNLLKMGRHLELSKVGESEPLAVAEAAQVALLV